MRELVLEQGNDQRRGLLVSVSSFLIMLVLQPLLENAISASRSICSVWLAVVSWLAVADEDHRGGINAPPRGSSRLHCEQCARRGTSSSDVAAVIARLGLADAEGDEDVFGGGTECEESCGGCAAMAVVDDLTETKLASEAELREAFYVFDRDEDGFVTAAELWNVMRRLGMPEGSRYDDCRRMIAAHDGDGDGRISFREFRTMMESAA